MIKQGFLQPGAELKQVLTSLGSTRLTQESTPQQNKNSLRSDSVFSITNAERDHGDVGIKTVALDGMGEARTLAPEDAFDKAIFLAADLVGSIWMLVIFVIGIAAWIGLGPLYSFSNEWQLWLNTCTALQQTLTFCLLTLARARHDVFVERCMRSIFRHDCELESCCRQVVGYEGPNHCVQIDWSPASWFERSLDWYAAFMGSGYMVLFSFLFVGMWVGIGHPMRWGDNWWLIIGTYTGLVGTFNASVLRYSLYNAETKISSEYDALIEEDRKVFEELQIPFPNQELSYETGPMVRLGLSFRCICGTPWTVLTILALIIALVAYATVVLWNQTAQLVVNSVTMIVESFFLIVLIHAQSLHATEHRIRLHDLLMRRLQLLVIHKRVIISANGIV